MNFRDLNDVPPAENLSFYFVKYLKMNRISYFYLWWLLSNRICCLKNFFRIFLKNFVVKWRPTRWKFLKFPLKSIKINRILLFYI